jgi:hypothetical protein
VAALGTSIRRVRKSSKAGSHFYWRCTKFGLVLASFPGLPPVHRAVTPYNAVPASLWGSFGRFKTKLARRESVKELPKEISTSGGPPVPLGAGVIPVLLHADGGALLARTYNHLRAEHSVEMSKKITFDAMNWEMILPSVVALPSETCSFKYLNWTGVVQAPVLSKYICIYLPVV